MDRVCFSVYLIVHLRSSVHSQIEKCTCAGRPPEALPTAPSPGPSKLFLLEWPHDQRWSTPFFLSFHFAAMKGRCPHTGFLKDKKNTVILVTNLEGHLAVWQKPLFKKCLQCGDKMPTPDAYSHRLLCLGEGHHATACSLCLQFTPKARADCRTQLKASLSGRGGKHYPAHKSRLSLRSPLCWY